MAALLTPVGAVGAVNACSDGVHLCAFRRDDGDCFGNGYDKDRDHDIQHDANDGTQRCGPCGNGDLLHPYVGCCRCLLD